MAMMCSCGKLSHTDFLKAYLEEQLDRQVLWILKKIPELDFEEKKKRRGQIKVDENLRSKVSFECGKTGFYITLFFVHLLKTLKNAVPEGKTVNDLANILDSNNGCLDTKIEDGF